MGEPLEEIAQAGLDGLQHLGLEQFYSRDGNMVDLLSDRWRLSKDVDMPIGVLCSIFPGDSYTLRQVLAFYARHSSPSHVKNMMERLSHYVKALNGAELFSVESILTYRASLDKTREWYLSSVRVLMRQWARMGYPGIPAETLTLLDNLKIKGNEKGRAVQSQCPEEGPLTDPEMQGIVESTIHCFTTNSLNLTEASLVMTLAMTGRRPAQISALKIKDLVSHGSRYFINFPRAKQRNMGWRSSFNKFEIVEDLWLLLNQQADYVRKLFSESLNLKVVPRSMDVELPLFPNMTKDLSLAKDSEVLESDQLHIPSYDIYVTVKDAGAKIKVVSERSGRPVHLNPNRFRYTLGTNLASEGKGIYVIAAALDHTDTQNAGVYVKNVPSIVKRIDKAVALELAPYAQAFRGVLISSEKQALRGNDPSSRISNGNGNVGSCGSHGFCGALAPVACYTCAHFQPWVDGPHEEILDGLIQERDRISALTGDLKVASANDRLIYAVSDVIHRCRVAKGEVK
jgi:integrase